MDKVNLDLKSELIKRFGTQVEAARRMGLREARLSYIIRRHAKPSKWEREALQRALGRKLADKLLRDAKKVI